MKKFSDFIANHSGLIVIISLLLLIPAIIGYVNTRINYDILVYLPDSVDTIKGENILTDDFGLGAYAFVMTDTASSKDILNLESRIKKIDGVNKVVSLIDVVDESIPISMLPSEVTDKLYKDGETIIMVTFDGSTSEDKTIDAVRELREVVGDANKVSSMTSMVIDTMDLSNNEILIYVAIAVLLCLIVLVIATDSYIIPLFLLGNIGVAILYNMGTNIIFGEISYITQAISAVLQLGVTTDFSIFLYHKYEEAKKTEKDKKKAMSSAIRETFKSVIGSSLTTFAGFLALCTMDLTLGTDIGLVMAKGIIWGLVCVLTLFPSLLLVFDKVIEKTKHKNIFPKFTKLGDFVVKYNKWILGIFIILLIPAFIGNSNYDVYYKLDDSLPEDLPFKVANSKLAKEFNIISPQIILLNADLKTNDVDNMISEIKEMDGVDLVLAPSTLTSSGISNLLPNELTEMLENDEYQIVIVNSTYEIASDELNNQIEKISDIVKKYDEKGIIAGEGALMKDLVEIADHDFRMVNYTSIIVIFIIMCIVLKGLGLPIILVLTIEFAIFCNMAVAYYTGESLPFVASIVVGTIQLGATIDYAILMSTRYLEERNAKEKVNAMKETLKFTIPSIVTSALCFFAATIGVAIYTKIDMIGSICKLLARGSIISMFVVILILPAFLMLFDKLFYKGKKERKLNMKKKIIATGAMVIGLLLPMNVSALEKTETVYTNLDSTGVSYKEVVNNHLYIKESGEINDNSELENILNITGNETYKGNGSKLSWTAKGTDIIYEGYSKKENPITFDIKYYLDNEEMNVKDMIGQVGKVKIVINMTNNNFTYKHNKKLYTPFVVTLGTYLDSIDNTDVAISNGKVVDTGTRRMLVGIASPGLYESTNYSEFKGLNKIVIEYNTKNFKQSDYYVVASPKLLADTDLRVFDKLDTLSNAINLIGDSMDQIEEGAKTLANKVPELASGTEELKTNLKTARDGIAALKDGSDTLDSSLKLVLTSLENVSTTLNTKAASLETLKEANTTAITTLTNTNNTLKTNYATYFNLFNIDTKTESEVSAAVIAVGYSETSAEYAQIMTLKKQYDGNVNLITLLSQNNYALTSTMTEITTKMKELTDAIAKIEEGAGTLSGKLNELKVGLGKLYTGSAKLEEGTNSLNSGVQTLSNGITKLNQEGIKVLVNKTNSLTSYETTLKDLVQISKEYNGYSSNNATNTIFIYKIDKTIQEAKQKLEN